MSGIFGILLKDGGVVEASLLAGMHAPVAFWGPDGAGFWRDEHAGMGHMLLRMANETPLGPVQLPDLPHLTLTADVRLDNREELFAALGLPALARTPDEHLLLRAYAAWGEETPRRLLGDFAFAIWDSRVGRLFAAVDQIGVRPLFYHDSPKLFAFASDIRAILAVPGVRQDVDPHWHWAHRCQAHDYTRGRTAYQAVLPVLPAHQLSAGLAAVVRREYWRPEDAPVIRCSEADAVAGLRSEFERAVRVRLRTDRRIGAHVSGGLDSTSVAVQAQRELAAAGGGLSRVYSWSVPPEGEAPEWDERWAVQTVCRREGWNCYFASPSLDDYKAELFLDTAFYPSTGVRGLRCAVEAERDGVGLILSGWGGDEFASYSGKFLWWELAGRREWRRLWSKARECARADGRSTLRAAVAPFAAALPGWLLALRGARAKHWHDHARRVLTPEQARFLAPESPLDLRAVRGLQIHSLRRGHLYNRTRSWTALGVRNRLEYRFPLLDQRLIEFVLSAPTEVWIRNGQPRGFFLAIAADLLPPKLTRRPKDPEWGSQCGEPAELRAWMDAELSKPGIGPHLEAAAAARPVVEALRESSRSYQAVWRRRFYRAA